MDLDELGEVEGGMDVSEVRSCGGGFRCWVMGLGWVGR